MKDHRVICDGVWLITVIMVGILIVGLFVIPAFNEGYTKVKEFIEGLP